MDRQPTTVVVQGTGWLETALRLVKLQETGLGVHLPVKVCCSLLDIHGRGVSICCFFFNVSCNLNSRYDSNHLEVIPQN